MNVTWIPEAWLQTPGRLCLARSPGFSARTRDQDLAEIAALGVSHIICLQEAHELQLQAVPETLEERRRAILDLGLVFTHEPIIDMDAPDLALTDRIVDLLQRELQRTTSVMMHCMAGLGRAGTLAACLLVKHGYSAQVAVAMLRNERPGAVQSIAQERHIRAYEERLKR